MDTIKIGIAGLNRGADYAKIFNYSEHSTLTAICDINPTVLADVQTQYGLADACCYTDFDAFLTADMDAVVISTPTPLHEEHVIKALKAGKHVFSEGNMATTVEGCMNIYEAVKASGKKYMLAENFIYMNYISEWKDLVGRDHIGRIHYAEAEYIEDIRDQLSDWRVEQAPIHYCTHCLGPLMYLIGQGDYITKTTAWGNKATIVEDQSLFPSTIDMQVALFQTKQGRTLKILRSQVTPRKPHIVTYNLYGTKGLLETGRTEGYDTVGNRYFEETDKRLTPINCNGTKLDAPLNHKFGGHGTSDYYGAQAFLDYIEFGKEPYTTVDRAVELTLPGIIAHEAAMKGHVWMDIPHV